MYRFFLWLPWCLLVLPASANCETWGLPADISHTNTSLTFTVDSTWHTVEGVVPQVTGNVVLQDPADPLSIVTTIKIPVRPWTTDMESRDERLREVMAVERFPEVVFVSTRLSPECHPDQVREAGSCKGTLTGALTIRDVTKEVALPVEISRSERGYDISGRLALRWEEYHVEDPSILIAKIDPVVTIALKTFIPRR
jgi:polyisoprenoid-binding protein YceI